MHNRDEIVFTPEEVDEQIEQIRRMAEQRRDEQEAFVDDLRGVCREYTQARDRVWTRLESRLAGSEAAEVGTMREMPVGSEKAFGVGRGSALPKRNRFSEGAISPLARMVAVVAVVVLVGSMLWVFTMIKHEQSAGPVPVQQPQKTQVPQFLCADRTDDHGLQTLCARGELQMINQNKPFGKQTLTLLAGYADANRVILWFKLTPLAFPTPTLSPGSTPTPYRQFEDLDSTLTTAQGIRLPEWTGAGWLDSAKEQVGLYSTFDATPVPLSARTLKLHLETKVIGIYPDPGYHASFDFSVPVQKSLVINTHQTVTVSGIPVTLQRVVISPSETRFFLASPVVKAIGTNTTEDTHTLKTSNRTWNLQNHILYGTNLDERNGIYTYRLDLYEALMNAKGMWTLTISKDEVKRATGDWVFHFKVG